MSHQRGQDPQSLVLRLNGVATPMADGMDGEGFVLSPQGGWRPLVDDGLYPVERQCVLLHEDLADKLFGGLENYYALLRGVPDFVSMAGLNSDSPIGRDQFERLLQACAEVPELNRFLYLYDCRVLVSAIQECNKEVSSLTGEFYRILNLDPFFTPETQLPDGTRWSTSPAVTTLHATLGFLFIRMHSLLDYLAKLAKEAESLKSEFAVYPKLACWNFTFGDAKYLGMYPLPDSVFEPCEEVSEVELVRNRLVHDGLLDDMPKAYEVRENGVAKERFVLMPDQRDGQFEKFKNRRLFYGREDRVNLRLAELVRSFQARCEVTLKGIRSSLGAQAQAPGQ